MLVRATQDNLPSFAKGDVFLVHKNYDSIFDEHYIVDRTLEKFILFEIEEDGGTYTEDETRWYDFKILSEPEGSSLVIEDFKVVIVSDSPSGNLLQVKEKIGYINLFTRQQDALWRE